MTALRFVTYAYPPLFYPRAIQIALLSRALPQDNLEIIAAGHGKIDPALAALCPPCKTVRLPPSDLGLKIAALKGDRIKRSLIPDDMFLHRGPFHDYLDTLDWNDVRLVTFGQPMSMHLIGLRYKKRFPQIRWTAHFSDPWNHESFDTAKGIARMLNHTGENAVYDAADRLVFTSPETIDYVMEGRSPRLRDKCRYVPHVYDPALYKDTEKKSSVIRIGYFGTFYGARQPDALFTALRILKNAAPDVIRNIKLCFYGAGDGKRFSAALGGLHDHVEFNAGTDYFTSLSMMRSMDGLMVIDAPAESSVFFPSKLADYLGAGRPVIGFTPPNGASARILRTLGMNSVAPDAPETMADALKNFAVFLNAGIAIDETARRQYRNDVVAPVFMQAIA